METLRSLLSCLIPGWGLDRYAEERTVQARRRRLLRQICQVRMSGSYGQKRGKIIDTITYDYFRTVIVWTQSQDADVLREEIIEQLQLFGTVTSLQDRWTVDEHGKKTWRGALAEYSKSREAKRAAADLSLQFRCVRFTLLQTVIDTLVDCELLYPDRSRGETSKVVISWTLDLGLEEVDDLRRKLGACGPVQTFYVHHRQTTLGTFCEVTYSHLTQAYLAATLFNGHLYNGRGVLTSSIDRTAKDARILADAKDCIVLLFQSYFPN